MNASQTVTTAHELADIENRFFDNPEECYDGLIAATAAMGKLTDAYELAVDDPSPVRTPTEVICHAGFTTADQPEQFHHEVRNTIRNLQRYTTHLTKTLARLVSGYQAYHGYDPLAVVDDK
jgi:hypothetical protein